MSHIKHDSVLLNKDHMFDEKLLNLNDFAGYVDRYHSYKFQKFPIINLGTNIGGVVEKNSIITDITINSNVKDLTLILQDSTTVNKVNFDELRSNVSNSDLKIFTVEGINDNSFASLNDINILGIDQNTTLLAEKLGIEYLYIEKYQVLVPLLKVTAKPDVRSETNLEVNFWLWFTK